MSALAVDYTRRAERLLSSEEEATRRARLHAAETRLMTARADREEIERQRKSRLAPLKAKRAKYARLLVFLQASLSRLDDKIDAASTDYDRAWAEADDAVMQAMDDWLEARSS